MTQSKLAQFLEEKLNLNEVYKFKIIDNYIDIQTDYYDKIKQKATQETIYFYGLITDYMGEYVPVIGSKSSNESCNVYLHIPTREPILNDVLTYLRKTFASLVVAQVIEEDDGVRSIVTMSVPNIVKVESISGDYYALINFSVSMKSSDILYFGNEVKIYLGATIEGNYVEEEVMAFDGRQVDTIYGGTGEQYSGNDTVASRKTNSDIKYTHVMYCRNTPLSNLILDKIMMGSIGGEYTLKHLYPNNKSYTKMVTLNTGTSSFKLGEYIYMSLVLEPIMTGEE